jgi:hypothetical protein
MSLLNSVRKMLGVHRRRATPPPGPRPRLGARIACDDLRMTVQAGLTDGTWKWLLQRGWREVTYAGDRRAYREVPSSWVARLFDATDPVTRAQLLDAAIRRAEQRPVVTLPPRH